MRSKLDAAFKACRSGAAVVIASARRENVVLDVLAGADIGTYFPARGTILRARQHWIAYTLRPSGTVVLDSGAVAAVKTGQRSLLPVGILGVRGEFHSGASVRLVDSQNEEIGRGLTRLGSADIARAAGKKSDELQEALGRSDETVVVHKDDLVLRD